MGADKGSGALWNNNPNSPGKWPLVFADKPIGLWNSFRIRQLGDRTWVWLNDHLVVDGVPLENYFDKTKPLFPKGPIQLQTHGNEVRWRNIFIREISPHEANALLRGNKDPEGFVPVFNGADLTGWAGETENYESQATGRSSANPAKGGRLYTKDEYGDFIARLNFKLPPGGNNGLAIRYPGSGDGAYTGMCELQVLDTEDPKYAKHRPAADSRLGLRHGAGPPRLSASAGPVELSAGHGERLDGQSRAERRHDSRHRPEQGDRVHGQFAASRQGTHQRPLRFRRA